MAAPLLAPALPDVGVLNQLAKDQLIHLLESLPGKKDLVLDSELMRPLDRVAGASLLRQHGVDKIFKLESGKAISGCDQRVYLIRPSLISSRFIADHINGDKSVNIKRRYKIIMTPKKLNACEKILEQEGVYGYLTIDEFPLDLIPLDKDILSMELPQFFTSFFLEEDQIWIQPIANSLVHLQAIFGPIQNVYGQGQAAKKVHELMKYMSENMTHHGKTSEIGHLFLIDRDVDYVTPLCTQVVYEGLLDDSFSIDSGFVEFGAAVTGQEKIMKILLTSDDSIYQEIRGKHFSNVLPFLSNKAKELQSGYEERHGLKSVGDMKDFVSNKLKGLKDQHKSLTIHIGACEEILQRTKKKPDFQLCLQTEHGLLEGTDTRHNVNYIEERINRQLNRIQTLRLMCLLSLTQDGVTSRDFKSLKTQFLQSEGYEQLLTLFNLKKLGLLVEQDVAPISTKPLGKISAMANLPKKSAFQSITRKLNLIPRSPDDINLKSPTDMSYVFSGAYTPLICKYVDYILGKEHFTGPDELTKLLPGPCFCELTRKQNKTAVHLKPASDRVILVYFLGGCTFTEIAALRFLGRLKGYSFIIATTAIINSNKIIEMVAERN